MATRMTRATPMNPSTSPPSVLAVHAGLVAVQLGFATHYVVGKIVMREMPPGALALFRAATAALLLLALHLARRGSPRVPLRDLPMLALCALLGIAANQVLFFEGLARSTAINASLLVTTIPIFTYVTSLALRREVVTLRAALGTALSLGGVLYLLGAAGFASTESTIVGDLLVVGNSLCYGVYLVLVGPLVRRHGSLRVVVWLFAFGALWVAPYGATDLARTAGDLAAPTWGLVAYIVAVATVFTYLVNAWALRHAPPSIVAIYIYLQPVATAVLAVLLLGEALTSRVLVAALLVFTGIYLVARTRAAGT